MSLVREHHPDAPAGPSPAVLALGALRTDLDDCLSRDPEGLFRTLRTDALRISLFNLLVALPAHETARVLDWMYPSGDGRLVAVTVSRSAWWHGEQSG